MDLMIECFVAYCRHVVYWETLAGYKLIVTLDKFFFTEEFSITYKTLVTSLEFAFFFFFAVGITTLVTNIKEV